MNTVNLVAPRMRSKTYRIAVFAFGVTAYFVGVAALLYAIAIMLGLLPFTGGGVGPLPFGEALGLDFMLLLAFGIQHSVMARTRFKAWWTQLVPAAAERSTYMLATGLVLVPALLLWQPMPTVVWSVQSSALRMFIVAIACAGWSYLFAASFAINHFELFGLGQVYQALRGRPLSKEPFKVRWMYRFDRHPIMTGLLIGMWFTPTMTLDHLFFAVGATVYVWVGVFFEQRALQRELGQPYEEYCERVGSIVPTLPPRRARRLPPAVL